MTAKLSQSQDKNSTKVSAAAPVKNQTLAPKNVSAPQKPHNSTLLRISKEDRYDETKSHVAPGSSTEELAGDFLEKRGSK